MGMIESLEGYKYSALALGLVSIPAFGVLAFGAIMFCDAPGAGPTCFKSMMAILAIPVAQMESLVAAWVLLKRQTHLRIAAGLMLLSVLLALAGLFAILRAFFR